MPAFAGMTEFRTFYKFVKIPKSKIRIPKANKEAF